MEVWKIGGHEIEIDKPDKILFPKSAIARVELLDYYLKIADVMVPHIKKRLITMHRFPHGIIDEGFYQRDTPDYFPSWIKRVDVEKKDEGIVQYLLCNNAATLVYLANQYCITPHVWLSRMPKINYPDHIIFDLDPSKKDQFSDIRLGARLLKNILENFGLMPFLMTTGSRGVHVVVPIKPEKDFDAVRTFAREIADLVVAQQPKKFTTEIRKAKRGGRVFIDTLRNAFAQTGVAPYAVRAKEGAPVATPIEWHELARVSSQKYTIKNIFRRLARKGDVWKDINKYAKSLPDRAEGSE